MKRNCLAAILIVMIGFSAVAADDLQKQIGFELAGLKLNPAAASPEGTVKVKIKDSSFQPPALTIAAGTRVEWHNQDGIQHSAVSDEPGLFDSGVIMPGKKYVLLFNKPGVYSYHCGIHHSMRGSITVTGAASASLVSPAVSSPSWSEQPLRLSDKAEGAGSIKSGSASISLPQPINPAISGGLAEGASPISGRSAGEPSSQIALQKFSSYYRMDQPKAEGQIVYPREIDLNDAEPQMLYFGSDQKAVPYSQYQSYALGSNSLWISGPDSWTQYAVVPFGSHLNIIAASPSGGYGSLYQVNPDETVEKSAYTFYAYNQLGFYASSLGEHQLFFNIAGQPSNVIVINVVPYPEVPSSYDFASITIKSTWLRGYNLYVDGSYQATEGMTGEQDGILTINVPGDDYHNIAVDGGGITFSDYRYFQAGYAYQLNI